MGKKFSDIQNAPSTPPGIGGKVSGKNSKTQNAREIPDTRETAGKAAGYQKRGKSK